MSFEKCVAEKLVYAKEVFTWMAENTDTMKKYEEFDSPDYAGMPQNLSDKLSSFTVDLIQDDWENVKKNTTIKYLVENILFGGF